MIDIARARWPSADGRPTIRMPGYFFSASWSLDAVLHRRDRRVVDDQYRALAVQQLRQGLGGEPAAFFVVAGDVADHFAAAGGDVGGEHRDPGALDGVEVRADGVRVARRHHDRGDVLGDEVLELRRLLRRVHLAGDDGQVEVARVRLGFGGAFQVLVEIVGLGQQRHADDRPAL
jgi:hypothetical protein